MFGKLIRFFRRPDINSQNTGHEAYQQYQGYALAGVNGNGGQTVKRTIAPMQKATIAVGPTHKLNDPTGTGNTNTNIYLQPLSSDEPASLSQI